MSKVASSGADKLLVSVEEARAWVRPVGRATFKLAPALKRFCMSVISKGCREILFDMGACTTLDSTFMGVLAGIAIWPVDREDSRVRTVVVNLNSRTRTMISSLGLERVVTCYNEGETPVALPEGVLGDAFPVDAGGESQSETLATMKQAHLDLIEADKANRARFCDVLTYLDEEIKRLDD